MHSLQQILYPEEQMLTEVFSMNYLKGNLWLRQLSEWNQISGVLLRGSMPEKSTFLRNWHPVRGPMSFVARGKRKRVKKG